MWFPQAAAQKDKGWFYHQELLGLGGMHREMPSAIAMCVPGAQRALPCANWIHSMAVVLSPTPKHQNIIQCH